MEASALRTLSFSTGRSASIKLPTSRDAKKFALRLFSDSPVCLRQGFHQVSRYQALLAHAFARDFARCAVKVDSCDDSFKNHLAMLSHHPRYHAGQYVARSASGHPWIASSVHPLCSIRVSDHSAMSLEHHDQLVFSRKCACHLKTVLLYLGRCGAD